MVEEQQSFIGGIASGVSSGLYEGVKGLAIGAATGAVAGSVAGVVVDALGEQAVEAVQKAASSPDTVGFLKFVAQNVEPVIETTTQAAKTTSFYSFAAIGAIVAGVYEGLKGLLGINTPADRKFANQSIIQAAQINKLATSQQLLSGAVMQASQELKEVKNEVDGLEHKSQVLGKYTAKILSDRAKIKESSLQSGGFSTPA